MRETPNKILQNIRLLLRNGAEDRNHGFHLPVFSNINASHLISSKIVVLRHYDEKKNILNFHTDIRSNKVNNLKKNSNNFFLFYDSKIKIQLKIKTVSTINFNNEITQNWWSKTNLSSRKCYLTKKNPSSYTNKAEDGLPKHLKGVNPKLDESEQGYKNFVVITNNINEIEWLNLSAKGHRRLLINFDKKIKKFNWLIP